MKVIVLALAILLAGCDELRSEEEDAKAGSKRIYGYRITIYSISAGALAPMKVFWFDEGLTTGLDKDFGFEEDGTLWIFTTKRELTARKWTYKTTLPYEIEYTWRY